MEQNWNILKNPTFYIKTVEFTLQVIRHLICTVSAGELSWEEMNYVVDKPSPNSSDFLVLFGKARKNVEAGLPPPTLSPTPKGGWRDLQLEFKSSHFIRLFWFYLPLSNDHGNMCAEWFVKRIHGCRWYRSRHPLHLTVTLGDRVVTANFPCLFGTFSSEGVIVLSTVLYVWPNFWYIALKPSTINLSQVTELIQQCATGKSHFKNSRTEHFFCLHKLCK